MKNNKPKTIRVSADTVTKLGQERMGFETPDECINRILSKNPCKKQEDEVAADELQEDQKE